MLFCQTRFSQTLASALLLHDEYVDWLVEICRFLTGKASAHSRAALSNIVNTSHMWLSKFKLKIVK